MKKLVMTIIVACVALTASAQAMVNVGARKIQSLDGQWKSIIDPYGHGNGSYWRDRDFDGVRLQDYDFESSPELKVPGDWNTQRPELYYYEGNMWYRKRFVSEQQEGKRVILHFGAANYKTKVWLNGKEIGEHEGGYTPFEFDVTDIVKRGKENSLVVRVNNERLADGIPTFNTDWWNYGGLTRSVCLVEVEQTYIYDYKVEISDNFKQVKGYVQLKGEKCGGQQVTVSIPELKAKQTIMTDAAGRGEYSIKVKNVSLWSPENPKLYEVAVSYGNETIKEEIGLRTIKTRGDKILLNGKEVFLAGVNIHEETFGDSRRAVSEDDDRQLLQAAKDMGCNFVRLAHYPHNEGMTKMADRMGLMVWSEIPLYWGINWRSSKTYDLAVAQLKEMIGRDHNRASVIIWSIANETAVNKERTAFLTNLANEARRLDDSRLISAALQNMSKQLARNVYTVEDPLHEALDLFSFNQYIGWYDNTKYAADSITWVLPEDKPIVISEFGGGARYGMYGKDFVEKYGSKAAKDLFFTEDNLVELYKHQFNMLGKIKGLAGTIPWVLKDFRSPHRMIPGVQDDFNRKGLYTDKGERKAAWKVVKEWNEAHK